MFIKQDASDKLFYRDFLKVSERLQKVVDEGKERHFAFEDINQDLYTMLYEPKPQDVDAPIPVGMNIAKQAIDQIKECREYQDLHRLTQLDNFAAGIATESIAKQMIKLLPPAGPKSPEELEEQKKTAEEYGLDKVAKNIQAQLDAVNNILQKADGVRIDENALRAKMRGIIQDAIKYANDASEGLGAFGHGSDPGAMKQGGLKEKLEFAKLLSNSPKLKEIAKLAGRFTRIARKKQMEKSTSNTVSSVQMGDQLARTLPSELGKLANPMLAPTFFKSFIEKTLLEYKLQSKVRKGQGPIICCIDSSGSMSGQPEYASKGIAMALMDIAKKEGRDFMLIQFGNKHELRTFEAPKGKAEPLAIMAELEFFFNGGTDFETPLDMCLEYIAAAKYNKADIVFVTDGCCYLSHEFLNGYKRAKAERMFSCIGVLIGPEAAVMNDFCDEIFNVGDLLNDEGNAELHDRIFKV